MSQRIRPSALMKKMFLIGALLLALPVVAVLGWVAHLKYTGNFHTVIAGQVYRSAQPSGQDLSQWVAGYGIRSVVNLRGAADQGWYRDEIVASDRLGLVHADFAMSDRQMLTPERAAQVLALIRDLPKPVLIHCAAGADRTGLVSALVLAANGATEAEAERQISFYFGHVSLPVSAAWPMDQSWEAMEPRLGYHDPVTLALQ